VVVKGEGMKSPAAMIGTLLRRCAAVLMLAAAVFMWLWGWEFMVGGLVSTVDPGEIVNVSPLLPEYPGKAREACKVSPDLMPGTESYACFVTVEENAKNHMFWWYVAPRKKTEKKPKVLVWLQGGPGASSLFGMFSENGPYVINKDLTLRERPVSWSDEFGMLYIDNPVGTGFSYTETGQFCNDTKGQVADQLFEMLSQFYQIFPELASGADLYITGESYGGHYVTAFGHKIYREIKHNGCKFPFRGISLGNAWVDPLNQVQGYPDLMYNLGLVSGTEKAKIQEYCDASVNAILKEDYLDAFLVWDEMLNGDLYGYPNYFYNITGMKDYFNYLRTFSPEEINWFSEYVVQNHVRSAIHVGDRSFGHRSRDVEMALRRDFMKSFKPELDDLLTEGYKVLIYNGALDIIINSVLTERYVEKLVWPGAATYLKTGQTIWHKRGSKEVAGFVKQVGSFTRAVVRNAGHMVPYNQPDVALDLIHRFVHDIPFN